MGWTMEHYARLFGHYAGFTLYGFIRPHDLYLLLGKRQKATLRSIGHEFLTFLTFFILCIIETTVRAPL